MPVGEDLEMLCRMWNTGPIGHVTEPKLYWYRVHEDQSIANTRQRRLRECGDLIFVRWRNGTYGGSELPQRGSRQILKWISWKMAVTKNDGCATRVRLLQYTYHAWRYRAIGVNDGVKRVVKALACWWP
jgi:hypothetical protein